MHFSNRGSIEPNLGEVVYGHFSVNDKDGKFLFSIYANIDNVIIELPSRLTINEFFYQNCEFDILKDIVENRYGVKKLILKTDENDNFLYLGHY